MTDREMEYKIEKNIPMPEKNKMREVASKMDVKDSVFFEGSKSPLMYLSSVANVLKAPINQQSPIAP